MPRSLPEWIGKTDDEAVPPRVRLRVLEQFGHRCDPAQNGCGRPIRPGDRWTCDHIKALINGGENRERNLHPLCAWCTPVKDAADVAEKANGYAQRLANFGIRAKVSRPLPGGRNSPFKIKIGGGIELRRASRER